MKVIVIMKQVEIWISNFFPDGIPISEVLKKYNIPCTNSNKLIFISMLKYSTTLTYIYKNGETIILCSHQD